MDRSPRKREIDVLVYDGVNALDVSGPAQAFDAARFADRRVYALRYVSLDGAGVVASNGMRLGVDGAVDPSTNADDLLVPGGNGIDVILNDARLLDLVQSWPDRSHDGRLVSVCSGALLLAAAGVLDGREATTHWSRETDARRYAAVRWDLNRLHTRSDRVFTSAGVTTGIDLALSIIRADCGSSSALAVARELVVQLKRIGGQYQYAMHEAAELERAPALSLLMEAIITHPERDWSLDAMAEVAAMNVRTLSRHFARHLGQSPAAFVERTRVEHAKAAIDAGQPLKLTAAQSGFGDAQNMRRAFQRCCGVTVSEYQRAFRSTSE